MSVRPFGLRGARKARQTARHLIPLGLGLACCWLLIRQLEGLDMTALWHCVTDTDPWRWGLALLFTALSFAAVARYDLVAHRHFQLTLPQDQALRAGAASIALGQTLGAGAVVGAFVRWRMQPGLGLTDAARISVFVAVTFLAALTVVIAVAAVFLPTPHIPRYMTMAILALALALVVMAFLFPVLGRRGRLISLPTLPALGALFALCAIDTIFAALALHVLVPSGVDIGFASLLPVFLIALGAAVLSGTPGGVGPFELAMLTMLPQVPEAEFMAAILGFRAIYYALPAILGGLVLLRALAPTQTGPATARVTLQPFDQPGDARAEMGVIRQSGGAILRCETGACGIIRTGQTLTALFDPVDGHAGALAQPLRRAARAQNRIVCKYKITARQAVTSRRAGWAVMRISDEAVVDPATHSLNGAAYRQLRRKLRHAETAGIEIRTPAVLPFFEMAAVSSAWEARHGVPRGVTMGRFDREYVDNQMVCLAFRGSRLVGFASFHATHREWCLDLMRVLPDAPDGTMHALVHHAIAQAAAAGVAWVSLAAAPCAPHGRTIVERKLRERVYAHGGGPGLRQFKSCFAPRWQPLYMAAPGPAQLTLASLDLIRSVRLRTNPTTPVAVTVARETQSRS